jgi:hypothetical protein
MLCNDGRDIRKVKRKIVTRNAIFHLGRGILASHLKVLSIAEGRGIDISSGVIYKQLDEAFERFLALFLDGSALGR